MLFKRLWRQINKKRKNQLIALTILTVIASIVEVASIGSLIPFLSVLSDPDKVLEDKTYTIILKTLNIVSAEKLVLPIATIFVAISLISGITRLALLWAQTKISLGIGADLSVEVFRKTLYQQYEVHTQRNSSEILAGAQKAKDLVGTYIQPILTIVSTLVILLGVLLSAMIIFPLLTLSCMAIFTFSYIIIAKTVKKRISENSRTYAKNQTKTTKIVQEGLGGIRDVIINESQKAYVKEYEQSFIPMQNALASNQIIATIPRYMIETIGMVLIATVAVLYSVRDGGVSGAVPILGALALAAQRLLPMVQQLYGAYVTIKGFRNSNRDAVELLEQKINDHNKLNEIEAIKFEKEIRLRDVGYKYPGNNDWIFRGVDLIINKGDRIGLVGKTGAGKSTLMDIIMGLIMPTEGAMYIDGKEVDERNIAAWRKNLSHVSQSVFITDDSIKNNIRLGGRNESEDKIKLEQAIIDAKLNDFVNKCEHGLETTIGERGIRLSGGQLQRIGIARALYRDKKVFLFDEATSALDSETESEIVSNIEKMGEDITIIMIAHRQHTLKKCGQIYSVTQDGLVEYNLQGVTHEAKNK